MTLSAPIERTSAMFLVLTIISMAGLFVLLHAFFLAAVQILVYAGAVIVLFLFVPRVFNFFGCMQLRDPVSITRHAEAIDRNGFN